MPTWLLIVYYLCLPFLVYGFIFGFVPSFLRELLRSAYGRKPRPVRRS